MLPRPPPSPLFPYTTLFRSFPVRRQRRDGARRVIEPQRPVVGRCVHAAEQHPLPVARREMLRVRLGVLQRHDKLQDRKSTRLNSSHSSISYAVFCLKKKKQE